MILAHIMAFKRTRFDFQQGVIAFVVGLGCVLYYALLVAFVIGVIVIYDANKKPARAQDWPNCREFGFNIATSCCCTANCCSEAEPGEFRHMGGNTYRSTVTGQDIERKGWSPDGRTVKCACDLINGTYTKHPLARVHCLFVPMPAM